jgi:hypothetical protein
MQHGGISLDEMSDGLEHCSGLAGCSGDLREIREAAAHGSASP